MTPNSQVKPVTLQRILATGVKLTPMMQQYSEIKQQYADHILLFRMGDFYEVFFEDATATSQALNIALTQRGKIGNTVIPMAGIPHHASATYLDKLVEAGFKAAICEQVEDPKACKGLVKRAVTQIVSPGMPFDLDRTAGREHHYMAAGWYTGREFYLVAIDFTTGEFIGNKLMDLSSFLETLKLYSPKEMITFKGQWQEVPAVKEICRQLNISQTHLAEEYFSQKYTATSITKLIPLYKKDKILNLFPDCLGPVGALAYYMDATRCFESTFHIRPFRMLSSDGKMQTTLSTLTGLEIIPKSKDSYKSSLLGKIDRCKTSMGSRFLKRMILAPLADRGAIGQRLDMVELLISNQASLKEARDIMSSIRDIERILAKVSTGKANAGDLLNIASAFRAYNKVRKTLPNKLPEVLFKLDPQEQSQLETLSNDIESTINDELGASLEKGNLIKRGANKQVDKLAKLAYSSEEEISLLEKKYRNVSSISKLRIKSNNAFGYFIEVSKSQIKKVPSEFIRKQTLVNVERYTSSELGQLEKEITAARDKLYRQERELFSHLIDQINKSGRKIQGLASCISQLDAYCSLAWVATQENFVRPMVAKDKGVKLSGAWHPLLKERLREQFVPHDIVLDRDNYFALITGPNMAGKTTVMREVAIIQVLAQMGSFVPAEQATVGVCDYLFSRLGASDDITQGHSTFMVEMSETAEIIRHATKNSLIILDEIGRGTSTYDGLSIAWALVEYFVKEIGATTLFSTHYHELIELADSLEGAKNYTVETRSNGEDISFLYKLIERGAAQSFGIYVAKLAGLPRSILDRSQHILRSLEQKNKNEQQQVDLFEQEETTNHRLQNIEKILDEINPLEITPMDALAQLDRLKRSSQEDKTQ